MESLRACVATRIALLNLITDTPERARGPVSAELNIQTDTRTNRQLSLDHEMSITQQLAFISAYSDDPCHVTAICIEEVADNRAIIRFSANEGTHDRLAKGLTLVAQILEDEACNSTDPINLLSPFYPQCLCNSSVHGPGIVNRARNSRNLLKAVISLNRRRILCRLRSRHARFSRRAKDKPSIFNRLKTAQDLLSRSRLSPSTFQALSGEIADIQRHFDQLEDMDAADALSPRSEDCLLSLVKGMNSLLVFEGTLRCIPHQPGRWNAEATDALVGRIRKSGHYVVACRELLKAARRYPGFSNIDIECADLQSSSAVVQDPDATVDKEVPAELLNRVSNHLGLGVGHLKEDVKRKLKEKARLHAEVQLVLFYEQQSRPRRPRIICASKRACYLCHLLLETQGKYIVPSTHGRLYASWSYPMEGLQALLPEFISRIELALQKSISQVATRRPHPVESVVHLLPVITPSNRSDFTALTRMSDQAEAIPAEKIKAVGQFSTRSTHTASTRATLSNNNVPKAGMTTEMATPQPEENDIKKRIRSRQDCTPEIHLTRGVTAVHSFTKDEPTLRVLAAHLHIHWECDMSIFEGQKLATTTQARNESRLWLEWLKDRSESGDFQAIDLAGNWDEMPVAGDTLSKTGGLILQRGSVVLRFRALPM